MLSPKDLEKKINTSYWYSDSDINKLLNHYIKAGKPANVLLAPDMNHPELLTENLMRAFGTAILAKHEVGTVNPKLPSIMPIQINGNHWVGVVIIPEGNDAYSIYYADPKGNPMPKEISEAIQKSAVKLNIKIVDITKDQLLPQQYNDNDCGPFTVDNLLKILNGEKLYFSEDGNAMLLRLHHARNLPGLFQPVFSLREEQIRNNLAAIAKLQAIYDKLVKLQNVSGATINVGMARSIVEEGLISLTAEEKGGLVGKPVSYYRDKLIISLADQLMNIPYKYGRENATVGIENKSKYFLKGGLIKLAEELKLGALVSESDIKTAIFSEHKEFTLILRNFYLLQMQERFNDQFGNYTSLYTQDREEYLKNKKALRRIELRLASKDLQEKEKEKVKLELEDKSDDLDRLKSLEQALEKLKLEKPVTLTDNEISNLKSEYEIAFKELYGLEFERLLENKSKKEKGKSDFKRDDRISALNQRVEELARVLPPQVVLGILYKKIDMQDYQITHTKIYSPMGFSIEKLNEEIKELSDIKRMPKNKRPFPWSIKTNEDLADEITLLDEKKKKIQKDLPVQEKLLERLKQDAYYQQVRLIYYNANPKNLDSALKEIKENISKLDVEVAELNSIKDFIFKLDKNQKTLDTEKKLKLEDYEKTKKSFLALIGKTDVGSKKKAENFRKNLVQTAQDVEQIDREMDDLKSDMSDSKLQIEALEKKIFDYESKMASLIEAKKSMSSITCLGFETYQKTYEDHHLDDILNNFQRALEATRGNMLATIAVIVDFVTWQNENCSDNLKNKIKQVIPVEYLAQFKDLRNSLMHAVDSMARTDKTLANSKEMESVNVALSYMIRCLQSNKDFLLGYDGKKTPLDTKEIQIIGEAFKAISSIPKAPGLYIDIGEKGAQQRRLPKSDEQIDIFKSVISVGKALISEIHQELQKDSKSYDINKIARIFSEQDLSKLSKDDILIRYKYDCLIQAFGECLGNLQQLDDTLMDLKTFNIKYEDYKALQDIVATAKEFRSLRAHSGYVNINLLSRLLGDFEKNGGMMINDLDKLYNDVRNNYKRKGMLEMFDKTYSDKADHINNSIERSNCNIQ